MAYTHDDTPDNDALSIADSVRSDYSLQSEIPEVSTIDRQSTTTRSKAEEAREEASASHSRQPVPQESRNRQSIPLADEHTPLLGMGPPPTYSDAIAAGARSGDARDAWRTNIRRGQLDLTTFSRLQSSPGADLNGHGPEAEHLPTTSQTSDHYRDVPDNTEPPVNHTPRPEGMRDAPVLEAGHPRYEPEYVAWRSKQTKRRSKLRMCCKVLLFVFGVIGIIILMSGFIMSDDGIDNPQHPSKSSSPSGTATSVPNPPDATKIPLGPSDPSSPIPTTIPGPKTPVPEYPGHDDGHSSHLLCSGAQWTETYGYAFNSVPKFHFTQESNGDLLQPGKINIVAAPKSQEADIYVSISYHITTPWKLTSTEVEAEPEGLHVNTPSVTPVSSAGTRACVGTLVTISIKPTMTLEDFDLFSKSFDIQVFPSLFPSDDSAQGLMITNDANITSWSGTIKAANLYSRKTYLRTSSGSITGSYALFDILSIQTNSGSVTINVDPKPSSASDPQPAVLDTQTSSGSVKVTMPLTGSLPSRDYRSTIQTHSGSISANLLFSSHIHLSTSSSSITANLLPHLSAYHGPQTLLTTSHSGHLGINILDPISSSSMTQLKASHSSSSSSIKLHYPAAWQGKLEAQTSSGSITVSGDGMRRVERNKGFIGDHQKWEKGDGDELELVNIASHSGSIEFVVGGAGLKSCLGENSVVMGLKEWVIYFLGWGRAERDEVAGVWCLVFASAQTSKAEGA